MGKLETRKKALVNRLLEVDNDRLLGHVEEILGAGSPLKLSAAQLRDRMCS